MQSSQSANRKLLVTATCVSALLAVSVGLAGPATAHSGDDLSGANLSLHEYAAQRILALSASNLFYTLPGRGGGGGGPGTLACGAGDVAVGIYGRSGIYIDQLGLTCAYLMDNGSLGPTYDTGTLGGQGGGSFRLICPLGQAIVGFHGGSGTLVDRLGLYCSGVANWRSHGSVEYVTSAAGGGGGGSFADLCPSDYVGARINVRTGIYVDRQELLCAYIYP
ncbi:hypothetical protein [Enhygromyxa salina]|uniref:Jacalin-like lectin domain protein n=1 Tax=Enhygromyxa salina TaxID=215803 RepID=A0A2S9YMK5_9BACT|nr:hypothetical protein [Enhygromyxa salina]PRQ06318.1 Jacalin-like lectin domain protein [Enhygromyxa salina]